jgi:hypothetical protein
MESFLIFLALLGIGLLLWASRLFFETYYDEVRKVSLALLGLFAIAQIILVTLIYFEFMESKIFEHIIYYNLIWAVPLGLLYLFARERCSACKSFETTVTSKELHSRFVRSDNDRDDYGNDTSKSIYEYLYEIHLKCNNCHHENYTYKLVRDESLAKNLSAEEAQAYLEKHKSGFSGALIAGLLGFGLFS